ncbi:hypothetical protein EC957_003902 [Mortierella hygrophila]|uniref:Uncharacterized protein n=1 Tax=Mortierella hygrophila TaxID=979708 RepID=A0A9P6F1E0_9FUNG|nr:hypothetical protein EC957_003902 [Mortierella hygrophila]
MRTQSGFSTLDLSCILGLCGPELNSQFSTLNRTLDLNHADLNRVINIGLELDYRPGSWTFLDGLAWTFVNPIKCSSFLNQIFEP